MMEMNDRFVGRCRAVAAMLRKEATIAVGLGQIELLELAHGLDETARKLKSRTKRPVH
jgi:hypothetical protein